MNPPKVIAEIGCNHKGDLLTAKEMIIAAAVFCKANVVKFQKRTPKELLTAEEYNAPHPNQHNSYGKSYGEHREYLEFNMAEHKQLMQWCKDFGITYSTSVWDVTSAKEIASLNPEMIKIPSASNLHWKMLDYLINNFGGEIHISTGMTSKDEIDKIVTFFSQRNRAKDVVLYSCTSGYPVDFKDICLLEITRLKELYDSKVKAIGFSGHHLGIAVDVAATTLGATWVERHFTLNRAWKGTDHAASLEPDGMRKLVRDVGNVHKSLTYKQTDFLDVEKIQRKKLKWLRS